MYLEIITPDRKVFAGEAAVVTLPGVNGSFQILNDHAAIVSTLQKGELVADKQSFQIEGGVVEVINNKPVITGWTQGRMVQRCHKVTEDSNGVYVELMESNYNEQIASDTDTCNERCAQDYNLHHITPTPLN